MAKLLVINSYGPMGSTLLASLAEKLGFSNIPLRKTRLHQYLMGEAGLNSGVMQARLEETLIQHSRPGTRGGVSVLDRDGQKPRALTDIEKVRHKLDVLKARHFESIQELYCACTDLYCEALVYKTNRSNPGWHIELTVDLNRFPADKLYAAYEQHFDEIYMLHLTRDFRGWINSQASQAIVSKKIKNRLIFFPHMRYADFALYEKTVKEMPGQPIAFNDLFSVPVEVLAQNIADLTGAQLPDIDFHEEEYDMYGKILPYKTAFKKFDDNIHYLRPGTLDYFAERASSGKLINNDLTKIKAYIYYLIDMYNYRMKNTSVQVVF